MALYWVAVVEKIVLDAGTPSQRTHEKLIQPPTSVVAKDAHSAVAKGVVVEMTDDMEVIVGPFVSSR